MVKGYTVRNASHAFIAREMESNVSILRVNIMNMNMRCIYFLVFPHINVSHAVIISSVEHLLHRLSTDRDEGESCT